MYRPRAARRVLVVARAAAVERSARLPVRSGRDYGLERQTARRRETSRTAKKLFDVLPVKCSTDIRTPALLHNTRAAREHDSR